MTTIDPYGVAQTFLTEVVAAWAGKPLPKMQWVAEGSEVAHDGEQVTVVVGILRPGLPGRPLTGPQPRGAAYPISAQFTIEVVRKRGAGLGQGTSRQTALPTTARDQAAGKAAGGDLTSLLNALMAVRQNDSVVSNATKMTIDGVAPMKPDGDLVGVSGTVTILLGH